MLGQMAVAASGLTFRWLSPWIRASSHGAKSNWILPLENEAREGGMDGSVHGHAQALTQHHYHCTEHGDTNDGWISGTSPSVVGIAGRD